MACINENSKEFKLLKTYWGYHMAKGMIKSYTKMYRTSQTLAEDVFLYPTVTQSIQHLKNNVADRIGAARYYFDHDIATEKGAKRVLQGIIHNYKGEPYVNKGYTEGLLGKKIAQKEVETPNKAFLEALGRSYPGLITLKPTQNGTKVLFDFDVLTPMTEPVATPSVQLTIDFTESYPDYGWMSEESQAAIINAIDNNEIDSTCK
jgi:hypothetical protein